MPHCSAAVSPVLRHGALPPLNPAVLCFLLTDTGITKSRELARKTRVVTSAIKHIHTYIKQTYHAVSLHSQWDVAQSAPCCNVFPNKLQTRDQTLYSASIDKAHQKFVRLLRTPAGEKGAYMLFTTEGNCAKLCHFRSSNRNVIFRNST